MKAIYGVIAAGLVGTGAAWAQEAKIAEGESAGVPAKVEKGQSGQLGQSGQSDQLEAEKATTSKPAEIDKKSLIGKTVYDDQGREIGRVQDLVMDMEKGELGYAVVEVKGEDGMKLPVPARALKQDESGQKLVLNVSESVLRALEIYKDEELPAPDAFSVEGESAVGGAAAVG